MSDIVMETPAIDPQMGDEGAAPPLTRDAKIARVLQVQREAKIAQIRHVSMLGDESPAGVARRNQAFDASDREARATARANAAKTGTPLTAPVIEAFRAGHRQKYGLPTAQEYSNEQQIRTTVDPNINPFAHGLQGVALTAGRGVQALIAPQSAEEQQAAQMAQQAHELERDQFSGAGRFVSHATELAGNVGMLAVPGLGPANASARLATGAGSLLTRMGLGIAQQGTKAALLGTTMTVPIEQEGIEAGMDPTLAMARAVGQTAIMDAVGGMKIPGLTPAAPSMRALRRTPVKEFATSTAQAGGAGAVKGTVMVAGQQTLDAAAAQIDAATPQSEGQYLPAAADFAGMDMAMNLLTRGRAAGKMGAQLRTALPERQQQLREHQPNPDVQAAWQQNPGEAASLAPRQAGLDMALRQNRARAQERDLRPAADEAARLRMEEAGEPDIAPLEAEREIAAAEPLIRAERERYAAAQEAQRAKTKVDVADAVMERRQSAINTAARLEAEESQARVDAADAVMERRQSDINTVARLAAEEQARIREEEAYAAERQRAEGPDEVIVEEAPTGDTSDQALTNLGRSLANRRLEKRYETRPEERPVEQAWRDDPEVVKAKAHYDTMMGSATADRTVKGHARQAYSDAVQAARERARQAQMARQDVDPEPWVTPQPDPERAVPSRAPALSPQEALRAQIKGQLDRGEITKAAAFDLLSTAARHDRVAQEQKAANAPRPAPVPQARQEVRPVRQARVEAPVQGQADQGVRSTQAPVEGRGGGVPAPKVEAPKPVEAAKPVEEVKDPIDQEIADAAERMPPATEVHPDITAARTPAVAEVARLQSQPGGKRVLRSAGADVMGRVKAMFRSLGRVSGAFQGNKEKALPMMVATTEKTMTPDERAKITHTEDLFGGSGFAGLAHRIQTFSSAGVHKIREWNEARLEKIRMVQTMTPQEIRTKAKALGVERAIREAFEGGASGGGITGRLARLGEGWIDSNTGKLKNPADKERAAIMQLYIDSVPRNGTQGGKKSTADLWSTVINGLYGPDGYVAGSNKLLALAKRKGINVEYQQGDSFNADVPKGDHVHTLMDPPYYGTSGYNGQGTVGADMYARVGGLARRLKENGNHVMYTDEAWWTRKKPSGADWKDGTQIQRGDATLRQIHDDVTTFDTHSVGERTESIATIHPHKGSGERLPGRSEPLADTSKPVAEGADATKNNTPDGQMPSTPWADNVRQGLEGGIAGREYAGQSAGAPIPGVKLRQISDRQFELIGPDGVAGTRVFVSEPLRPENVNPTSWYNTRSEQVGVRGVQQLLLSAKMDRNAVAKVTDAESFATTVPGEIQRKLFAQFQPGGEYTPGQIVIRVSGKGEAQLTIAQRMSHEAWHDLFDVFVPQGEKDAALADLRARGLDKGSKLSANRADGDAYKAFLEKVQQYNNAWTKERATANAAMRKQAGEGFVARIKRWANSIASMLGMVEKTAAGLDGGLDLVIDRMRKGEYKDRQFKSGGKAPAGEKPAYSIDETLTEKEEAGRTRAVGRVQPIAGIEHSRAQAISDAIGQKVNEGLAERHQNIKAAAARADEELRTTYNNDPKEATKGILRRGRIDSLEEMHLLQKAMDETSRQPWGETSAKQLTKMADLLNRSKSFFGQMLAHGQNVRSPQQRLAVLRTSILAPSANSQQVLDRIHRKMETSGDLPGEMERLREERDRILSEVTARNIKVIKLLKEKYGIDLEGPEAVNYTLDEGLAADIASIANHEMKGARADRKFTNTMRAALLSDVLQTQSQQLVSNVAMTAMLRNPLAAFVSGGRAGLSASRGLLNPRVFMDGLRNGVRSFKGQSASEQERGMGWGAPRNVDVSEKLNVDLGRMDDPTGAHPGESKGILISPLNLLAFRPMAFIDGTAQRINSRILEAELYYKYATETGATHAEASAMAKAVLDGIQTVPHEMQVEALHRSLDATFQDLAIAQPGKPGSKSDTRHTVNALLNIQRAMDQTIPLSTRNEAGEQTFVPLGSIAVPFVRTGVAIARAAVRLNPVTQAGYMGMRKALGRYEGDAGKVEKARDLSYLTMGTVFASGLVTAMATGALRVMGTETDENRKRLINDGQIEGALPEYTAEIAGYKIPFGRVEPLATVAASFANAVNEVQKSGKLLPAAGKALHAYYRIGSSLAWFGAIEDARQALETPTGYNAENKPDVTDKVTAYLADEAVKLYPAILRGMTQDEIRDAFPDIKDIGPNGISVDEAKRVAGRVVQYLAQRTGVQSTPPKYTVEGKEVKEGSLFREAKGGVTKDPLGWAGQKFTRGGLGKASSDSNASKSLKALDDYKQRLPPELRDEFKMPYFARDFTDNKQKYHLSPKEYATLQRIGGQQQAAALADIAARLPRLGADARGLEYANKRIQEKTQKIEERLRKSIIAGRANRLVTPPE